MDRFIDFINLIGNYNTQKFKIQYGYIYINAKLEFIKFFHII